ncbi:MAG: S8 family serine peptidase [Gemmatimonadota bacterium]
MAERPLLILPTAETIGPPPLHGGGSKPIVPPRATQANRIAPSLARLKEALNRGPEHVLELRDDPTALAPDRVIVFEIAGSVADFARAASRVPGLELMVEYETENPPDDFFAEKDTRKGREGERRDDKLVDGRLYLAMPDITALGEFIRLWDRWVAGREFDQGFAPFKHLFAQLREVRPWGPRDRIPEETIAYWQQEARDNPDRPVRTEVELWFRRTAERREQASRDFRTIVAGAGGAMIHEAMIPEIAYHGALIDIPAAAIPGLVARQNVALALADDVMFLRPQTVLAALPGSADSDDGPPSQDQPPAVGQPIVALLDGVPLQGHERLAGRLALDDPDDLQARALVNRRFHGTAMASLILHGDLNAPEAPLARPVYVRPLMIAPADLSEHTPGDRLLVDTLYNAILRIKGTPTQTGVAPNVFLVNLSLGDSRRPFANLVSPLARLIDYLAAKDNILFLVSAGNISEQLMLPDFNQWGDFEAATPEARERAVLMAMFTAKHERSLLSPAEAVNALTIGAQHADNVANRVGTNMTVDPFDDSTLPNASCALGLGYRRAVKPDLFLPGGREHVRMAAGGGGVRLRFGPPQRLFGLGAAAPDSANMGRLNQTSYADGTSAATALATRAAHRIFDSMMDRDGGSLLADVPPDYYAVVIKCLLVHSARWNEKGEFIKELCGPSDPRQHVERAANATRFLGFGVPDISHMLDCAENQATLVGFGTLQPDNAHNYRIPLPPSLEGVTDPRQLAITVAWFTPVRAGHQSYRTVKLVAAPDQPKEAVGVVRFSDQPASPSVRKGTVFHERYFGQWAVPFIDDGHLSVRVLCKDDAGNNGNAVRYAIAVTIEVGTPLRIYEEVSERLRVRPRAPA